jgi:hypothetical protein
MAEFVINTPIETEDPRIEVTVARTNPLQVGRHRFQLIVVDDSGNQSAPDAVEVRVFDDQLPTAVLRAPERVGFGQSFPMTGEESVDVGGGRIVRYIFTYLGPITNPLGPIRPLEPIEPVRPVRPIG